MLQTLPEWGVLSGDGIQEVFPAQVTSTQAELMENELKSPPYPLMRGSSHQEQTGDLSAGTGYQGWQVQGTDLS